MSHTPEGSPTQRPLLNQSPTFDFNCDVRNESDIKKIVPNLKGEVNWPIWEHRLYMVLKEYNEAYIKIIQDGNTRPTRPCYLDITENTVGQIALLKMGGDPELVTDIIVQELTEERKKENAWLRAAWRKEMGKLDQCNFHVCNLTYSTLDPIPASHIGMIENAREAYKILYAEYGTPSWLTNFERFEVLRNLQYKGNNTKGLYASSKKHSRFINMVQTLMQIPP